MFLSIILVGCSSNIQSSDVEKKEIEFFSVAELNKTVWVDSEKAFDILVKRFEDISSVTDEEFEQLNQYFQKYYDSGYVDMDNAEQLLVFSIKNFEVQIVLQGIGNEDEQNERHKNIQRLYMEIDQMLKEH